MRLSPLTSIISILLTLFILAPLTTAIATTTLAMASTPPEPPKMTLLYRMEAKLGDRFSLGPVPTGQERIVIPIVGGSFEGPRMSGTVLSLGADWRLTDAQGKIRPDARYNIQTEDGSFISVNTEGVPSAAGDGRTVLRGRFETSTQGKYAWLNDVVAVGVLTRNGTESVLIDMWEAGAP